MMRLLQTSSFIFQKNNRTVTLTRQDFLTDRGYRAGFDVYIKFDCDILLVSSSRTSKKMQSQEDTGAVDEVRRTFPIDFSLRFFSFHWFFMSGRLQEELSCRCKSTCSTKSGRIRVGCPPLGPQANGIEKNANESTIHNNNTAGRTKYDQTTIMTRFTRKSNSTEEDVTGFSSPYLCSRIVLNSGHPVQKSKCGACAVTGYCSFKSWTFHCKHYILS